jgi:hypothetical protein
MDIQPRKKKQADLTAIDQEAIIKKAQQQRGDDEPKKLRRYSVDVPEELSERIEAEAKRLRQSKRAFWLMLAEEYFERQDENR